MPESLAAIRQSTSGSIKSLYAITPTDDASDVLAAKLSVAFDAGLGLLQYRRKQLSQQAKLAEARQYCEMAHAAGAIFIVNDDLDLALEIGADGVHWGRHDVGTQDLDSQIQRAKKGKSDFIVGISCYNDFSRAIDAVTKHADYIAFGSIYVSKTKPEADLASLDLIHRAKARFVTPIVAIGGITRDNVGEVVAVGADAAAVITDLWSAPLDEISERVATFQSYFTQSRF